MVNGTHKNFFMETISNSNTNSPGGVFRALEEGVDKLVYMFKHPPRTFVLDVRRTVQCVRALIATNVYEEKRIQNVHFVTKGYALPISESTSIHGTLRFMQPNQFTTQHVITFLKSHLANNCCKRFGTAIL